MAKPRPRLPERGRTFIREWRRHRDLTLDQLIERMALEFDFPISNGQLSRIERGEQPYTQDVLEVLALALRCSPGDLLTRRPEDAPGVRLDELKPDQREVVLSLVDSFKRTGTGG